MAANINADTNTVNDGTVEPSPPAAAATTAKPVLLQKQPGEVNIEALLAKNRR